MPIHRMVSPPLSPCPPQAGSWCSRLERRPYVRLIVLGNEPRHANGLGPRIPKLPSEFDLCTNESHPLTRSSPCEDYRRGGQQKTMTVSAEEFIRRFLIHVPPCNFQRIRYYGFLGNRYRAEKLAQCRRLLAMTEPRPVVANEEKDYRDRYEELTGVSLCQCPVCNLGRMMPFRTLPPITSAPPSVDTS